MNRRDFFRRTVAALALLALPAMGGAGKAEPHPEGSRTTPQYHWDVGGGELVIMPLRPLNEEEVAAMVQREPARVTKGAL